MPGLETIADIRPIQEGELYPGFEALLMFQDGALAAGRTRATRDSPLWSGPIPNPARSIAFIFPRYPYSIRLNGELLPVTPNHARVIQPGSEISAVPECRYVVDNFWIHVTRRRLGSILAGTGVDPGFDSDGSLADRDAPLDAQAFLIQQSLVRAFRSGSSPDLQALEDALSEIVLRVCFRLAGQTTRQQSGSAKAEAFHREATRRAKLFILERFTGQVSLDDVARAAGMSRSHLCLVFRNQTGLSVHEFVNDMRLREAVRRLPDYHQRVGELGIELGFSSASHFVTAFGRRFGVPPTGLIPPSC